MVQRRKSGPPRSMAAQSSPIPRITSGGVAPNRWARARIRPTSPAGGFSMSDYFQVIKKEGNLGGGALRAVRAVHNVLLNILGEIGPDGAGSGLAVIRGPHQVPVDLDGVFPFQDHGHDGPGTHELSEAIIKGPLPMHRIKGPGLLKGETHLLQ